METVSTTTVQSLVNLAMTKAQNAEDESGHEEGVIGHTNGDHPRPIACGVYWTTVEVYHGTKTHIESIEYEPEPDVIIGGHGDHFRSTELEDTLWDAEDELAHKGLIFDDVIRESGVEYSDPDVEASWKGGEKHNAQHCYWIEDVDALIQYTREEYC